MGSCVSKPKAQQDAKAKHAGDENSAATPATAKQVTAAPVESAEPASKPDKSGAAIAAPEAPAAAPAGKGSDGSAAAPDGGRKTAVAPAGAGAAGSQPAAAPAADTPAETAGAKSQAAADPKAKEGDAAAPPPLTKAESQALVLKGQTYLSTLHGPPRPQFHDERVETLRAIKAANDSGYDPNIKSILNLALSVFGADAGCVMLLDDEDFTLQITAGKAKGMEGLTLPWLAGICGYSLLPKHHEVLVVEDMAADARYNTMPRPGYERFYCGAPLVAANGHRLGTMCIGGSQPRKLDAHQVNVLCNMAEMIVRHLEKAWAEGLRRKSAEAGLLRAVEAYTKPFLFLQLGEKRGDWNVIFANSRASDIIGVKVSDTEPKSIWDILQPSMSSSAPWTPFQSAVDRGVCFTVTGTVKSKSAHSGSSGRKTWNFHLRPAERDALDKETELVGVPAHVPSGTDAGNRFYIAEIAEAPNCGSERSQSGTFNTRGERVSALAPAIIPVCFEGLQLGPLLGKGSFGRVYRGTYHGEAVAIKIMDTDKVEMDESGEPLEAVITGDHQHPNLVNTIAWTVTSPPLPYPGEDLQKEEERIAKLPPDDSQTWLLLEFCDRPCLQDAVDRGLFREGDVPKQTAKQDMAGICATAHEIAVGMGYLHSKNVVHGDLKGGNVLLKSADNERGFVAKVADFGMARELGIESRIKSNKYGTITHCPPELITTGHVSKGVDIYAFGVLLWELYTGTRAWAGLSYPQIMHAVGIAGTKLQFDRSEALPAHETYFQVAEACMAADPEKRPAFSDMHLVLKSSAEAWAKLKEGPGGGALPQGGLHETACTRCVG